ncbi:MAG: hypothetical protein IPN03_15185 [Holophagales bacterium]|nr:hypothetical protein [Holophagales bacterium]
MSEGVAHHRERCRDENRQREEAEGGRERSPAPPRHDERDEAEEDREIQRKDERGRDLRGEEHASMIAGPALSAERRPP